MIYTISRLRQEIFGRVYDVYEIFQNFFGEAHTDLQGMPSDEDIFSAVNDRLSTNIVLDTSGGENGFEVPDAALRSIKIEFEENVKPQILVWWPRVKVTNENDRSIDIQDLYAKIKIRLDGTIPYESRGFFLIRTTFDTEQFSSGYLHSHVPRFSSIPAWSTPCLGTGPINNTIMDLKNNYEETLWMLFCQELSLYVTVESLRGVPYFKLETVGSGSLLSQYQDFTNDSNIDSLFITGLDLTKEEFNDLLRNFTRYYLENGHLSLSYKKGKFVSGMPYYDFIVDISNSFIDFFNSYGSRQLVDKMYNYRFLVRAITSNGKFYRINPDSQIDNSSYEGTDMITFKGEMKHLHIKPNDDTPSESITLISNSVACYIFNSILRTINFRYRNEYNNQSADTASSAYQTVCYL